MIAAASDATAPASSPARMRAAFLIAIGVMVIAVLTVGSHIWPPRDAVLQAAVRFEGRLAEEAPAAGLQEVRAAGANRAIYLHREVVVSNEDVVGTRVVQGNGPERFGVAVELNAQGAQKMQQATANHIGKPLAILIDGDVVMAPVLRSPISKSALISGDFTKSEAERIANGIGVR